MRKNLFIGAIFITFGILFLLDNLGIADAGDILHDYWPLILIVWGLSMLFGRERSRQPSPTGIPAAPPQTVDRESFHESNIFGSLFIASSSQQFKGGSTSTIFGDCDIDLTNATFADGEYELRCSTIFGDSVIILPEHAAVSVSVSSMFGSMTVLQQRREGFATSFNISTPDYESQPKRLKITISKIFGNSTVSSKT